MLAGRRITRRARPGARALPRDGSGAVLVPEAALQGGSLWVVEEGRAMPRAVEASPAGPGAPGMLLITQGLAAGERVIIAGLGALSPGMDVRVE